MNEYEIYALKCAGPISSSGAFVMWLQDWEKTASRNYYIWCIRNSEQVIVVDACVSPDLAAERNIPFYISPVDALSQLNIEAKDVKHVIITHAHWDHVNGLPLFPNAKIYIQEGEYYFWLKNKLAERPPFKQFLDIESKKHLITLMKSSRLSLLKGDQEILPGIECVLAPGHSVALQAVAVKTTKGTAVLGSDCAHLFRNYRDDWPSSLFVDLAALMRTYDRLVKKASSMDLLFPGHDPAMTTDYETITDCVSKLV